MLTDAEKADRWIDWNGGTCPVDENVLVEVMFREGNIFAGERAEAWYWGHSGNSGDIIAYRVEASGRD